MVLLWVISVILLLLLLDVVSLSRPAVAPPRNRRRSHSIVRVVLLRCKMLDTIIVMSRPHISCRLLLLLLLLPGREAWSATPWPSWRISGSISGLISETMSVVSFELRVVRVLALNGTPTPRRWGTGGAAVPGFDVFRLTVSGIFNESLLAASSDCTLWSGITSNLEHKLLNKNTLINMEYINKKKTESRQTSYSASTASPAVIGKSWFLQSTPLARSRQSLAMCPELPHTLQIIFAV